MVRALPRIPGIRAFTLLNHVEFDDIKNWIEAINPIVDYLFLVNSHGKREWVGNIIVFSNGDVIIEMLAGGAHVDLAQSRASKVLSWNMEYCENPPHRSELPVIYHSRINTIGRICHHPSMPVGARHVAHRALSKIRMTRGEYVPGYYEFVYGPDDGLYFIEAIFESAYSNPGTERTFGNNL